MASKNKKTGFFSLYFKNFRLMLIGNLLFSVPMVISIALVYGIAFLLGQTDNMLIIGLVTIPVYPFFSGVTQITKDIVAENGKNISAFEAYKKGLIISDFFFYTVFSYIWHLLYHTTVYYCILR